MNTPTRARASELRDRLAWLSDTYGDALDSGEVGSVVDRLNRNLADLETTLLTGMPASSAFDKVSQDVDELEHLLDNLEWHREETAEDLAETATEHGDRAPGFGPIEVDADVDDRDGE